MRTLRRSLADRVTPLRATTRACAMSGQAADGPTSPDKLPPAHVPAPLLGSENRGGRVATPCDIVRLLYRGATG